MPELGHGDTVRTGGADLDRYRRPEVDHPAVRELLAKLGLSAPVVDLGGTMSLNLLLPESQAVVRVHPRFVSRARLTGLRALRRHLAAAGLTVGYPLEVHGTDVVRAGPYLAELEAR